MQLFNQNFDCSIASKHELIDYNVLIDNTVI